MVEQEPRSRDWIVEECESTGREAGLKEDTIHSHWFQTFANALSESLRNERTRLSRPTGGLRRIIAARTTTFLQESGVALDRDGVRNIWPYKGLLIVNPFRGCNFGCVYCFRSESYGESSEWFLNGVPVRVANDWDCVEELTRHRLFKADETIVGLHTATTDAFLPTIKESTFTIIDELARRRLRNPIMLITKYFLTDADIYHLESVDIPILLLLSYTASPPEVEPLGSQSHVRRERLATVERLRRSKISWAHYYRPIIEGWNDSEDEIAEALRFGESSGISVIGGLKMIPKLHEYAAARGLPPLRDSWVGGRKHLPQRIIDKVLAVHNRLGLKSTIVSDQSCALTLLLSQGGRVRASLEGLRQYDIWNPPSQSCFGQCPEWQLAACSQPVRPSDSEVAQALVETGYEGVGFRISDSAVELRGAIPQEVRDAIVTRLRYAVH